MRMLESKRCAKKCAETTALFTSGKALDHAAETSVRRADFGKNSAITDYETRASANWEQRARRLARPWLARAPLWTKFFSTSLLRRLPKLSSRRRTSPTCPTERSKRLCWFAELWDPSAAPEHIISTPSITGSRIRRD